MPKPNLSSASVDALLKLRDEIADVLAHRAALLRDELSKLGNQIGSKGKVRGSSLKGRKVAVKYRDRSGNTWAGRGAQPVAGEAESGRKAGRLCCSQNFQEIQEASQGQTLTADEL